jgi:putative two-component system response regulator
MHKYNLLLVDDTPENLRFLAVSLKSEGYRIRVAPSGELALSMAHEEKPDLILLDIDMPGMNGYEVCNSFKKNIYLKKVPVIFLSALHDNQAKIMAFHHGGVDYVTKPFRLEELLARIATHLELNYLRNELEQHNQSLVKMVSDQFQEIYTAQLTTIFALIKLAESRDDDTGTHIDRVGSYALHLTQNARQNTEFNCDINDQFESDIYHAAAMHDVGKVGISDTILLKPGRLTSEEFEIMKTHTTVGHNTLASIHSNYPNHHMIGIGVDIAHCHHEKWNGQGYPCGLKAEEIPLSARIVAIADVYDALRAKRPYKQGFSHQDAYNLIVEGKGTHFDPRLIDIFESIHSDFNEIWNSHQ